ncbi:MAG: iron-sulfur cluster assembly scaffold protein [Candidatus Berkelbacteria bacterium]|nr:iron-sulfur cluster assembly scaffold protein [Candidatus Berkelbacteria bacterium]
MDKKYSKKVMEHFLNPRNVGKIKNPSGRGRIGNAVCGDVMEMTIKVEKKGKNKIVTDAKFLTFGCGAAVATSSIVTELVKGKTLNEAKKLTPLSVDKSLGNLPIMKKHCARLAIDALHKAIEDYELPRP